MTRVAGGQNRHGRWPGTVKIARRNGDGNTLLPDMNRLRIAAALPDITVTGMVAERLCAKDS